MVEMFVKHVLSIGGNHPGLYRNIAGYYGTVEQQGRLSLHLHMLLWLKGVLSPQEIRNKIMDPTSNFQRKIVEYLKSVHIGEFMTGSMQDIKDQLDENQGSKSYKNPTQTLPDPPLPMCTQKECKVDPKTGALNIKKGEAWINTFTPIVAYLFRCNSDTTSLMSGTAIIAVTGNVSDYVTKPGLKTHVLFDAVRSIFQRNTEILAGLLKVKEKARKLVTQTVTSPLCNKELFF
ncbi:hypothetical protein BDZ94DRAFT_1381145 [Collybia nuda]|uniref:Helitron helicase-like domain-containing protein n=1 Tax=Collybia nuda TaxID=64659 RepID=A0A9P5XZD5_9AGAR|nr:hypothetical protein BDZ94DRAFT_1381145 [Collybia nuda]